ncbi:MAG: DNA repair protein RecO [Lachnospiraceae bacterium]|nr:DNA repair protein RecO [Lachnospiraceae bacterium]
MDNTVTVQGMVIKSQPVGEFDRRIVILTKESGKISVYARGARKINSSFAAASNPFTFGSFHLYVKNHSYYLEEVEVRNYFPEMRSDMRKALYGMYFLEIADYYGRENNDELNMLILLYQSVSALLNENFSNRFVRTVFELKVIMVNGEFPGIGNGNFLPGTINAVEYLVNCPAKQTYSFRVTDEISEELKEIAKSACEKTFNGKEFTALQLIEGNDAI